MSKKESENAFKKLKAGDEVAIVKGSSKEGTEDYIKGTIHSITENVLWNPKDTKAIRKGLICSIIILEGEEK